MTSLAKYNNLSNPPKVGALDSISDVYIKSIIPANQLRGLGQIEQLDFLEKMGCEISDIENIDTSSIKKSGFFVWVWSCYTDLSCNFDVGTFYATDKSEYQISEIIHMNSLNEMPEKMEAWANTQTQKIADLAEKVSALSDEVFCDLALRGLKLSD